MNPNQKGLISKFVFQFSNKPFVLKDNLKIEHKFPNSEKGGLIISADFEMAWAFRFSKRKVDPLAMAAFERENIPVLLQYLEKYSIPITWATVGHLFLESCNKGDHDWMHRIPHFDDHWKFTEGDWFDCDPYTNYKKDNAWYAPDLVEMILKSSIKHEIGCHTFSHIDCSDKNCPPEVIDDELKASKDAAARWGINMKSLVFPGGTAGNYAILKKNGFKIYRKNIKYDMSYPFQDELGMLITPTTSSFGRIHDWSSDYYIFRYRKMIDKAVRTNTIAHFWLHPSVDKWTLKNVIPDVLCYAAELREKGMLWIGTLNHFVNTKEEICQDY